MNYIRVLAWSVAVSTASLLTGCMDVSDSTEPSVGEAESAIERFNVRHGPSFESGIKYQIPGGTFVSIKCVTTDGAGNRWYQLADNGFILATLIANAGQVGMCGGPDAPPGYGLIGP